MTNQKLSLKLLTNQKLALKLLTNQKPAMMMMEDTRRQVAMGDMVHDMLIDRPPSPARMEYRSESFPPFFITSNFFVPGLTSTLEEH